MREEKQMLMQRIQSYDREVQAREEAEKKLKEAEEVYAKMQQELQDARRKEKDREQEIHEY
jgi:hypothetical protein